MAMRNLLLGSIAALGLSSPAAAIPLAKAGSDLPSGDGLLSAEAGSDLPSGDGLLSAEAPGQPRRQLQVSPSLLGAIDIDLCAVDSLCDRQLVPGKHHTWYQFWGATCSVAVPDGLSLTFSQTAEEATLDFSIDTIALSCGPINWAVAYRKDWAPDMAARGTVTLSSTNAAQNSLSLSARITQNSDDAASPGLVLDPTCSASHTDRYEHTGFALDMQLDGSDLGGDIVDLFEGDIKNAIVRAVNGAVCSQTVGLPSKLPGLLDAVLDEIHPDDARYQVLAGGKTRAAAATVLAATALKGDSSVSSSVPVPAQHTMKTAPTGNGHYTISGGSIRDLRGRYDRLAGSSTSTNPTCNNKSIYKKSGGDYYLFMPDGASHWAVSIESDMSACRNSGHLTQTGRCTWPTSCVGEWRAATGTDASGTFGDYNDCAGTWCDDPNVRVH